MPTSVEVATPSRLHFGMFSFGQPAMPQFGGVGVMIDRPGLQLRIDPAERFATCGPMASARRSGRRTSARRWQLPELPACRLEIVTAPPEHAGLGTGTQLELAVTAGLNAFRGRPPLNAQELAAASGRGARSAIGTYGFLHGGLLVERGKPSEKFLSPLERRVELPGDWRFVLVSRRESAGWRVRPNSGRFTNCRQFRSLSRASCTEKSKTRCYPRPGPGHSRLSVTASIASGIWPECVLQPPRRALRLAPRPPGSSAASASWASRASGKARGVPTVFAVLEGRGGHPTGRHLADTSGSGRYADRDRGQSARRTGSLPGSAMKESAGTLIYQLGEQGLEVLLVHPSGNYNRHAAWSIPKGHQTRANRSKTPPAARRSKRPA